MQLGILTTNYRLKVNMSTLEETVKNATVNLPVKVKIKESIFTRFLGLLCSVRLGIVLLIVPSLRHIAFGARTYPTGMLLVMFVLLSGFWAGIGLRNGEYFNDRIKCFYGIGASVVCVVLAFVIVASAPVVERRPVIRSVPVRTGDESQEQLQNWRDNALNKYKQQAQ